MGENPYEPSKVQPASAIPDLQIKAQQLHTRRNARNNIWFYVRFGWRRQLLFIVVYVVSSFLLWYVGQVTLATACAAFCVGRTVRDFQWWSALSREWPTTAQFIDWQMVDDLAQGEISDDGRG